MSATEADRPVSLADRNHFLLRRLHSLSGIVPVGAFLTEHLLTNAGAWYGATRYNDAVQWIQGMPFLPALEFGMIILPLAFHALYGAVIAWPSSPNAITYPYMSNTRYTLQRITAWTALVFVVIHLLKFRFAHLLGGPVFAEAEGFVTDGVRDWFALTRNGLLHWHIGGLAVPAWFTLSFYVVGLTAAVYHFANGIWTFAICWGLLGGPQPQRWFSWMCLLIGAVLCAWGYMSLYGFVVNEPIAAAGGMPAT